MKDRLIGIRLTSAEYRKLEALAAKMRRNISDTVRELIYQAYEKIKTKEKGE